MENINKKSSSLKEDIYQIKYDDYNKIEWINYFNEDLIVESINNRIINIKNENKIILNNDNLNNSNINIIKKTNISNSNKKKNINIKEVNKKKEIIINKQLYENKNYFFSEIKEIYGPKKILSFEYEEKFSNSDFSDRFNLFRDKKEKEKNMSSDRKRGENNIGEEDFENKKFSNVITTENDKNNKKINNKDKLRSNKKKNKSVDSKSNNNNENNHLWGKNNYSKNSNNKPNLININNFGYRRYESQSSYVFRHKLEKKYKLNGHFYPNEEKQILVDKQILLGRTMLQMTVLNNYGLVNDDDYELYQNIVNYNKLNNKRNKRYNFKNYINGNTNNNNTNNKNHTLKNKTNLSTHQNERNEIKIDDENIKSSYI